MPATRRVPSPSILAHLLLSRASRRSSKKLTASEQEAVKKYERVGAELRAEREARGDTLTAFLRGER